ncbi:aldehyde dehydrogenase family protein [Leifsonia poae]|uniref:aldehyde dehydrogenase family protein n=1 Tax=Leifsonia poae TaxID=110933 RepID=UPI001CBF03E7|nr:aldehyde dehydrogenase family protein [Leifsonia poae]
MSVDDAVARATASGFEGTGREDRARWLEALAEAIAGDRAELVRLAAAETHLSEARLDGEITRTDSQLRFFAGVARDGGYLEATLDAPDPTTTPPRPDLRRMLRPLGAVAVYAASNFPFAFSVLGNDTASALAAGCPVIVKGHPGHPETSRRTAALAERTLAAAGAPDGCFGLVEGMDAGVALVQHPGVAAVGFTGSERGGRALFELAAARERPIPFYGELGSINPVVVTESAARERPDEIATGLVGSFTRDAGQFCTKPGLVFIPAGARIEDAVATALMAAPSQQQLTEGMTSAFAAGAASFAGRSDVQILNAAAEAPDSAPTVVITDGEAFTTDPEPFLTECFGPLTVLVRYLGDEELQRAIGSLDPSLTATILRGQGEDVTALAAALAPLAGRLVFDGWPTGVAIAWAQHHGGAWPATTASVHSSVGASAIRRFLTPIAYQDAPQAVLPPELRDHNPANIPRREASSTDASRVPRD